MRTLKHQELSKKIIAVAYNVHNELGNGFLEKVYENAMIRELGLRGLHASAQYPIKVRYKDAEVGDYYADILVEGKVIVELKTGKGFNPIHEAQLLNYLKATGTKVGLLINIGPQKCEYRRFVY